LGQAEQPDLRRPIAISVVILWGFLSASSSGEYGRIAVVAFAIALPLLTVLIGGWLSGDPTRSTATFEITKAVVMVRFIAVTTR
jgi:hypothetical protein